MSCKRACERTITGQRMCLQHLEITVLGLTKSLTVNLKVFYKDE